jgi:hypothetical protein
MVHQEAARARELVFLLRDHADRELLIRKIGPGKLMGLGQLGLVDIHGGCGEIGAPGLELFEAVLVELIVGLTRGVVVGRHQCRNPPEDPSVGCRKIGSPLLTQFEHDLCPLGWQIVP